MWILCVGFATAEDQSVLLFNFCFQHLSVPQGIFHVGGMTSASLAQRCNTGWGSDGALASWLRVPVTAKWLGGYLSLTEPGGAHL